MQEPPFARIQPREPEHMPIYEFACADCGVHFDRLQKISDPDPDTCADCGGHAVTRCVTAPSFRLAGSGWYETDFKQDKNKQRNLVGTDKPAPTESTKAEPTKADAAKPATGTPAPSTSAKPAAQTSSASAD